tara:strand:+ start:3577 stop:3819 length:243 start_codon:yes stop_codon:yes gene_type:complete
MNDHQDSENFSYNRSWDDIEKMLYEAEREQNKHYMNMRTGDRQHRVYHMRNYKALEGVITGLRWVLGDLKVSKKQVLGRE